MKGIKKENKCRGITLIALVITIIILLILSGITIVALNGDNGILKNAIEAKEATEIEAEKEIVNLATTQAIGKDRNGNIEEEELRKELENLAGDGKVSVSAKGDYFEVEFTDSKRKYKIDKNGDIIVDVEELPEVADEFPGDITDGGKNEGTERNPYKISSVEDYVSLIKESRKGEKYVDKYISLETTLDFTNPKSYIDANTKEYGDYNEDGKTEGLIEELKKAKGLKNGFYFCGILDGKNNSILNIYMYDLFDNHEEDTGISLFYTNEGIIKNLNVSGTIKAKVTKEGEVLEIGGIVTKNYSNAKIMNCTSNMDIIVEVDEFTSLNYMNMAIGGITGVNKEDNIIENCMYTGNIDINVKIEGNRDGINDLYRVGGIAGKNEHHIVNCVNKGNININTNYTEKNSAVTSGGGIAGKNDDFGVIENCINYGDINVQVDSLEARVGGISGEMEEKTTCIIKNASNIGNVKGISSKNIAEVGGIIAEGYGVISNVYNVGKVEGESPNLRIGGIIGNNKYSDIFSISNSIYNKVEGLYAAEGEDISGVTPQNGFTQSEAIQNMNKNADEHNSDSNKIYEWIKF